MTNEVVKAGSNLPAATQDDADLLAQYGLTVEAQDLVIPKVLLMQGLSELVDQGVARAGDIVENIDNEVLAKRGDPLTFIAFYWSKEWLHFKKEGDRYVYDSREPTRPGLNYAWEEEVNGEQLKHIESINVACMLPDYDLTTPYIVSFKSSGFRAGKQLLTQLEKLKMKGLFYDAITFKLNTKQKENEGNKYYVYEVHKGDRYPTDEEKAACREYLPILHAGEFKTDDSDLEAEVNQSAKNVTPPTEQEAEAIPF